jgi:hypothetical protein
MSPRSWSRRHRWWISERPQIGSRGDENVLFEEYGEGTHRPSQPAQFAGTAQGGLGPVSGPTGLSRSEDAVSADAIDVG